MREQHYHRRPVEAHRARSFEDTGSLAADPDLPAGISGALQSAVDLFPMGFMALSRGCQILAANRAARRILASSEIAIEEGRVALTVKRRDREFRDLVERPHGAGAGMMRIPRPPRKPLLLLSYPLPTQLDRNLALRTDHQTANGPAAVLVFLADLDALHDPDAEILRGSFGLTPAEARVAGLLMQGRSVEELASALGIAANTARNHLKRLFSKTATKRQGELVRLLWCSPASLVGTTATSVEAWPAGLV